MKDPLHHDEVFGLIWKELFDKKGALAPSLQHSDKMKALLACIQREGANQAATGGPSSKSPLTAVLECFSFAKQRFDSTIDPGAKLSLMLLPVATLLAFSASDGRVKLELRQKNRNTLAFLTSKNVSGLGLSADWGLVWESFLRLFDAGDHDIAGSSGEIDGLIHTLEKIFVDGAVFQDKVWKEPVAYQPAIGGILLPPVISHNMGAADVDGQFINAIVAKQIEEKWVFNVGGAPVVMWGPLHLADKVELADRLKNITKLSVGRLRADFPRSEMRHFLRAFDLPLVKDAFGPQGSESKRDALTNYCKAAVGNMRSHAPELASAILEYKGLAKLLAGLAQPGQPLADKPNRAAWGLCLDTAFLREHLPGLSFTNIQILIRFYESILDGSCGVERGLAKVRACIKENQTTNIDVLDDLAVALDANLQPADMAKKVHGCWEAGAFGLECAALWREVLGARMGIYGSKCGIKRKVKAGTYKSVKGGVLKAIGAATVSRNLCQPLAAQGTPSLATVLAARASSTSSAGTAKCPYWTKGFPCLCTFVLQCRS